jgi:hypothetical protein
VIRTRVAAVLRHALAAAANRGTSDALVALTIAARAVAAILFHNQMAVERTGGAPAATGAGRTYDGGNT